MVTTTVAPRSAISSSTAWASAAPSSGAVPTATSSSSTSTPGFALAVNSRRWSTCAEKVERLCSRLWSSPTSVSTAPKSGSCDPSWAGMWRPARAISESSPQILSATVLPPAFGPETTRVWPKPSSTSFGTQGRSPRTMSGWRARRRSIGPASVRSGWHGAQIARESGRRVEQVETGQDLQVGEDGRERFGHQRGQRGQDPSLFVGDLELGQLEPVVELDDLLRLDEQGLPRLRRAVDDPAHLAPRLHPHRDHIAIFALGGEAILQVRGEVAQLEERAYLALELFPDLLRAPPEPTEGGRGAVREAYRAPASRLAAAARILCGRDPIESRERPDPVRTNGCPRSRRRRRSPDTSARSRKSTARPSRRAARVERAERCARTRAPARKVMATSHRTAGSSAPPLPARSSGSSRLTTPSSGKASPVSRSARASVTSLCLTLALSRLASGASVRPSSAPRSVRARRASSRRSRSQPRSWRLLSGRSIARSLHAVQCFFLGRLLRTLAMVACWRPRRARLSLGFPSRMR